MCIYVLSVKPTLCFLLEYSDTFVTGSADTTAKIWDVQYGKEKRSIQNQTSVRAVALSENDSKELVYATDARMGLPAMLVITPLNAQKPSHEIAISGAKITTVAWSLDNRFIYTGHEDGTINAWDPKVTLLLPRFTHLNMYALIFSKLF